MKKLTLLAFLSFIALPGFSYTWNPVGPDSASTTRLCFNVGLPYWVICADDGMYLYNYSTLDCQFYTYSYLPVVSAFYLNPDQILVAMGDGSWSDGIYRFDLNTHEFEVIFWIPFPTFLEYHEPTGTYWLGSQFGSMYTSADGLEWTAVPFFEGKSCICFDSYGEWMVVSVADDLYNIYWSDDSGMNWHSAEFAPIITDLKFNNEGELYGIFPDYSDSSGLWFSEDHGNNWQVTFWSDNMSAVGFDAFGNIFVGWAEEMGIAHYDPQASPPGLTFLNNGLPNLSIHKIQLNPAMSAPAIFVCTAAGAYYSYDYMVGDDELVSTDESLQVYPNPVKGNLRVSSDYPIREISIWMLNGEQVYRSLPELREVMIDVALFKDGMYVIRCRTDAGFISKKCIISHQE